MVPHVTVDRIDLNGSIIRIRIGVGILGKKKENPTF